MEGERVNKLGCFCGLFQHSIYDVFMLFHDHESEVFDHTRIIFFISQVKCIKIFFAEVFCDEKHSGKFVSDEEIVEDFSAGPSVSVVEGVDAFKVVVEKNSLFEGAVAF